MGTNHTKGEWTIAENHIECEFKSQYTILSESTHTICEVTRHNYKQVGKSKFKTENELYRCDEAKANAKLIAAAPDLLEALKTLLRGNYLSHAGDEIAQEAINKATN